MSTPDKIPNSKAEVSLIRPETANYLARRAMRATGGFGQREDMPLRQTQSANEGWQTGAECVKHDPEMFFPGRGQNVEKAKEVCETCDVKQACLNEALTRGYDYGIWGGATENQRRAFLRYKLRNGK